MRALGVLLFLTALVMLSACSRETARGPVLVARPSAAQVTSGSAVAWSNGELETNRIDILIVFDGKSTSWLRKKRDGDMEAFARRAVNAANDGLARTGLDKFFSFRLAGVRSVKSDFSGYRPCDLAAMSCKRKTPPGRDGKVFARIRKMRKACKADLVAVLSHRFAKGSGIGGSNALDASVCSEKGLELYRKFSYCACDVAEVEGNFTLLHEIGHLLGAGHTKLVWGKPDQGTRLHDFSTAYVFQDGEKTYTTVMGYPSDGSDGSPPVVRLPFFSSPDYMTPSGIVVGTVTNDNTRTLRETFAIVANFQVSKKDPNWKEPEGRRKKKGRK